MLQASSAYKHSLKEVLASTAVAGQIKVCALCALPALRGSAGLGLARERRGAPAVGDARVPSSSLLPQDTVLSEGPSQERPKRRKAPFDTCPLPTLPPAHLPPAL